MIMVSPVKHLKYSTTSLVIKYLIRILVYVVHTFWIRNEYHIISIGFDLIESHSTVATDIRNNLPAISELRLRS